MTMTSKYVTTDGTSVWLKAMIYKCEVN